MNRITFLRISKSTYSKKVNRLTDLPPKIPIKYLKVEDSYSYRIKYTDSKTIKNVLVVKKPNDQTTSLALQLVSKYLNQKYNCNVIVEPHVPKQVINDLPFIYQYSTDEIVSLGSVVDLVVALGGDGSILHVSSLFNQVTAPPLLSFAMGNLGFLLPFRITDYAYHLSKVFSNNITLVKRDRLTCQRLDPICKGLFWNGTTIDKVDVVNEVNIHRGSYPNLTTVSCWVDGHHLTNGVADGLLVATPTGSTAYSLSAGGPIVHPLVETLLLTPICPRSLSFRPVLLPLTSTLKLTLDGKVDSLGQISLDGRDRNQLNYGESIQVKRSNFPIYSIDNLGMAEDWGNHINRLLKWNQNFSGF